MRDFYRIEQEAEESVPSFANKIEGLLSTNKGELSRSNSPPGRAEIIM